MIDPITETDLSAYVDGELSAIRRVEVEAHLAEHPEDAARVMADLRDRDALREAFVSLPGEEPDLLRRSAKRVDRALAWQRVGGRLRRAAVLALMVGAGWLAHSEVGSFGVPDTLAAPVDPILMEEAEQAREAVQIRARSRTLPASAAYDHDDLKAATGLNLPLLPLDLTVRDVQVFPARYGAGVEISLDGEGGDLSLFATRSSPAKSTSDWVTQSKGATTAYWQVGETCYALTGSREGVERQLAGLKQATHHH